MQTGSPASRGSTPPLATQLKRLAVANVKPRVNAETWQRLRDPLGRKPSAQASKPLTLEQRLATMSLNELATHFGTDKWGVHWYTQHYDRHFQHLRAERFTLLEIGVGGYNRDRDGGKSLRTWKQYFPKAHIIGLDIEDKSFVDEDRIRTYQGSQTDHEVLQRILDDAGDVQVVIDDGSHRPEHIRQTFAYLFPRLSDDGIYAIEDTQTSYWPVWGGSENLSEPSTTIAMVKDFVDGIHYEEFIDADYQPTYVDKHLFSVHAYHNLVILEKGRNVEGTRFGRSKRAFDPESAEYQAPVPVAEQRLPFSVPVVEPPPPEAAGPG